MVGLELGEFDLWRRTFGWNCVFCICSFSVHHNAAAATRPGSYNASICHISNLYYNAGMLIGPSNFCQLCAPSKLFLFLKKSFSMFCFDFSWIAEQMSFNQLVDIAIISLAEGKQRDYGMKRTRALDKSSSSKGKHVSAKPPIELELMMESHSETRWWWERWRLARKWMRWRLFTQYSCKTHWLAQDVSKGAPVKMNWD